MAPGDGAAARPRRAREHQQVLREPASRSTSSAAERSAASSSSARAGPAQRELQLGLEQRERRPELVARVGDESALACDAPSSRASISFSVVAEPVDLVVGGGHGEAWPGASLRSRPRGAHASTGRSAAPAST